MYLKKNISIFGSSSYFIMSQSFVFDLEFHMRLHKIMFIEKESCEHSITLLCNLVFKTTVLKYRETYR